jgi:hypothetical protein
MCATNINESLLKHASSDSCMLCSAWFVSTSMYSSSTYIPGTTQYVQCSLHPYMMLTQAHISLPRRGFEISSMISEGSVATTC